MKAFMEWFFLFFFFIAGVIKVIQFIERKTLENKNLIESKRKEIVWNDKQNLLPNYYIDEIDVQNTNNITPQHITKKFLLCKSQNNRKLEEPFEGTLIDAQGRACELANKYICAVDVYQQENGCWVWEDKVYPSDMSL